MKFSEVVQGIKATKAASYNLDGQVIDVLLRPLDGGEEVDVMVAAVKSAEERKLREPKPGHPVYDAYLKVHVLALACLDPESPDEHREAHFDKGIAQVFKLGDDEITVLYEKQRMWQEEISPSLLTTSTKDLFKIAEEVSERGDPFIYASLPLGTRWLLQRLTASLLCASPAYSSLRSLLSGDSVSGLDPVALRKRVTEAMEAMKTGRPAAAANASSP